MPAQSSPSGEQKSLVLMVVLENPNPSINDDEEKANNDKIIVSLNILISSLTKIKLNQLNKASHFH